MLKNKQPLPKSGEDIEITAVHSKSATPTFREGEIVKVISAYEDDEGNVFFRALARNRKHVMTYSSKTYDWEIIGREWETFMEAQEETAEFVKKKAEERFEEIWKNWQENQAFPPQFFENPKSKWMMGLVFYTGFEEGWNQCLWHAMDYKMKNIELCMDELGKLSGVNIKDKEEK